MLTLYGLVHQPRQQVFNNSTNNNNIINSTSNQTVFTHNRTRVSHKLFAHFSANTISFISILYVAGWLFGWLDGWMNVYHHISVLIRFFCFVSQHLQAAYHLACCSSWYHQCVSFESRIEQNRIRCCFVCGMCVTLAMRTYAWCYHL